VNRFAFVSQNAWECFGVKVGTSRGSVIYDGFDFVEVAGETAQRDVRREFGIPEDARIVGMVARIARQKDYETLVRAAARVVEARPAVRFLVVGDHEGQPDYRLHYGEVLAMVAEAGLTRHFIFTGHREDVVRLLAAMDVHVLCTHSEGFALAVGCRSSPRRSADCRSSSSRGRPDCCMRTATRRNWPGKSCRCSMTGRWPRAWARQAAL
jgi:glycosyltransferase involved in cell wall biosynthesis